MSDNDKNVVKKIRRSLSFGEEVANSVSHGAMIFIMIGLLPYVAIHTYLLNNKILDVVAVSIFCISVTSMFMMSTIYHIMKHDTKHKQILRILDHIFIYVAIAGSYTPIGLSVIGGPIGITLVCVQWLMVLFGILYKSLSSKKMPKASLAIYLIMGWLLILIFPILIQKANPMLLLFLILGGIAYSVGALIYSKEFRYNHFIWHLFVVLGVVLHFIAIVFFLYK